MENMNKRAEWTIFDKGLGRDIKNSSPFSYNLRLTFIILII